MSEALMILFMGQTGSGKSWLIHAITGSPGIQPSKDLNASKDIKFVWYNHSRTPLLLVEVPGFDNTKHEALPDLQILTNLATWLAEPCPYPRPTQVRIAWLNGQGGNTPVTKQVLTSLTTRLNGNNSTVVHQIELEDKPEREKEYAVRKLEDLLKQRDGFVSVEKIRSVLVDLGETQGKQNEKAQGKRRGLLGFFSKLF